MIFKFKILTAFILFIGLSSNAQEYLPSATPDRVILTWQGSPATSQAVSWRSDVSVSEGQAQITEAKDSPELEPEAKVFKASTTTVHIDSIDANYHTVNFIGLKPETRYAYRVGSGDNFSEWFHFRTAARENKPFSFIYFGDAQNELKSHWSRVIRQAYSDLPDAAFMLHAGDLINRTNVDREWGEWFYAGSFIHAMISCIPTPGNHEYYKDGDDSLRLSRHWNPTFALPNNGPKGLEESVYYIDYQGTRIVSLNSQMIINSESSRLIQAKWLEDVLKDNPNKWTCITFHHPIFSTKEGRDNPEFRNIFKPIFDKYKVDLVLQGHDHTYGRGSNIPGGVVKKDEKAGTMYVISVSGPKMYDLSKIRWMDRAASNTQLYQLISIDGNRLSYAAYTATGKLYDAFDLIKQRNKSNKLVNKIPEDMKEKTALPPRYLERYTEEELKDYNKTYGN